jgi:uncharacterized protein with von Willebrand factor type A (vWA) domain
MSRFAVAQINRLAHHLVWLRPQPHRYIHLVRGRRVEAWIKLVDAAAHAVEAASGGRYSRTDFQRKTITSKAAAR